MDAKTLETELTFSSGLENGPVFFSSANIHGDASEQDLIYRPNDVYRNLIWKHFRLSTGKEPFLRNPHFAYMDRNLHNATVIHFSDLGSSCPVPGAKNIQLIGRRELLDLAREQLDGRQSALRHRLLSFMDQLLLLEPIIQGEKHGLMHLFDGIKLITIPEDLPLSYKKGPDSVRSKPVQYQGAGFHTGPYNYLNQPDRPRQGSIHMRLIVEGAESRRRPFGVLFTSPDSVHEAGVLMRTFSALHKSGIAADLLVLFFGTAEEFENAIRDRPESTFFGDNYFCPTVRCLFGPFHEMELIYALQHATAVFDTVYGGTLDFLAKRLNLRHSFTVAADGRFAERQDGMARPSTLDLNTIFSKAAVRARDRKIERRAERSFLERLEEVFGPTN